MYTGPDGKTHIEELALDGPVLSAVLDAEAISFRSMPPGHFIDWHPAPRRQFVITLSGEVEIGLEDGSLHRYGPGHVALAEDLTGKGHTTRVVGATPRLTATIPLK
jgi:quercetin dioxygenase-like cupin family protein